MKRLLNFYLILAFSSLMMTSAAIAETQTHDIPVTSKFSIVQVRDNAIGVTDEGLKAVKLILEAIDENKPESARKAADIYDQLLPEGRYGGDYTALKWFAEYIAAPENKRENMIDDKLSEK